VEVVTRHGRSRGAREHDERVGGHRPIAGDDERVDVDLGDLGVLLGDAGDGQHDVDQPPAVDGRLAAERPEQLLRADETEELLDLALVQGRDRERDVTEHLGHGAAQAEGDDGPEGGVTLHAHHELAGTGYHLFHQHSLERGARPLRQLAVGSGHLFGLAQVEEHELRLGLVLDVRAHGLERQRTVDRRGQGERLSLRARKAAGGHRDAVGGQQALGLVLVQGGAPLPQCRLDDVGG